MPLFHDAMPLLIKKKRGAMYCWCALFHFFKRSVRSLGRRATTLANYQILTPLWEKKCRLPTEGKEKGVVVFCFVHNYFFGQHKSSDIYFSCPAKRNFFFQNLTLGYMTKTLNQIFFFLHQNQNFFFSNPGNQNIFLEKKHNPLPLEAKWSVPYLPTYLPYFFLCALFGKFYMQSALFKKKYHAPFWS